MAVLDLDIRSSGIEEANRGLERLVPNAQRAETATEALARTMTRGGIAGGSATKALNDNSAAAQILAQRVDALRAQLDPLAASYQRLGRATAEANSLFKAGALTQGEHAVLVKRATEAHVDLENRVARSSKAAGLSANDWRMLSFQANDAATMLLSGSSAFQVLATQGGQVLQIMQGANGGVRGALAGIASTAGVTTLAVGSVTAALVAGALAYNRFDSSQKEIGRSLLGSGRSSGLTPGDITDIARRSRLGTGLSEQLASDFARTGNASAPTITRALGLTRDLAASMGTDWQTAGKALTGVFENPSAALDKLNERFRFLTAGQRSYIASLQDQGREQEAVTVGLDALSTRLGRYNETASFATRMTDRFSRNWDDFATSTQRGIASALGDERADTLGDLRTKAASTATEITKLQRQITLYEQGRESAFSGGVSETNLEALYPVEKIKAKLSQLITEQESFNSRILVLTQARATAQRIAAADEVQAQTSRITTVVSGLQRRNATARLNPVQQEVAAAEREAGLSTDRTMATGLEALAERLRRTGPTLLPSDQRSSINDPIVRPTTAPPIAPRTDPRMFAEAEAATKSQLASSIQREVQEGVVIGQRKQLAEATRAQTLSLEAETRALGRNAGASEAVRQKAALRVSLGQQGVEIDRDVTRQIDAQSDAYGRLVQRLAEAGLKRDMEFQRAQLGRTPQEAAIAASLRPVYGDDLGSKGAQTATEYMRATMAIQDTQRAMSALGQMGSGLIDPLLDSTRSWGDAFEDLSKQIARAALQATLFGTGPFAGSFGAQGSGQGAGGLFGTILGGVTGGGGFGSILGGLFGGGSSGWGDLPMTGGEWFANGGIMTSRGRLPLNAYEGGGIANSPQVAVFGEGKLPEAYVPLPDGRRIPVAMQGFQGWNQGSGSSGLTGPTQVSYSPTYHVTPANGVTPQQLQAVIEQNNRQFAAQMPQMLTKAQQRMA